MLEVLVALAIAIPALLLLYRQGAYAIGVSDTAATYAQAVSRAQSRLDTLIDTALQPGERSGDDGGPYRWRTEIVALSTAPAHEPQSHTPYAAGVTLYAISVRISWPGPNRPREVVLNSRRLGPARDR